MSESEAVFVKEKCTDITFFAVVRDTCTKSEMPTGLSEFYGCSGTQILAMAHQVKCQTHPMNPKKYQVRLGHSVGKDKYDLVKYSGNIPRPPAVYTPNYGIWRDGMTLYIYLRGT